MNFNIKNSKTTVGIFIGLITFFTCYWFIGSITMSITVGVIVVAVFMIISLRIRQQKKGGKNDEMY